MAVYHCHTHPISRSGKSGSAIACAAYRAGEALKEAGDGRELSAAQLAAYRTGGAVADGEGRVHDYSRKGGVAHAEIMLPDGVDAPWAQDRSALWNQADGVEKRSNSRVAREWRIALPHELGKDERIAAAREFAGALVELYGIAADVAVHEPSRSGDQRNWHAHVLCTTRQITNEGFGDKAELEWSNTNLAKEGKPYSSLQIREIRMLWQEIANEHLAQAGHEVRIDHRSLAEQGIDMDAARTVHVGQHHAEARDRELGTERILPVDRLDFGQSERNAAYIEANPSFIIEKVVSRESAFQRRNVAAALHRYVNEDWNQFDRTLDRVMADPSLVKLMDAGKTSDTGREVEAVWSTKAVAMREAHMLDAGQRLAGTTDGAFSERAIRHGIAATERGGITLSDEQREAVETIGREGRIAVLRGVAGTGKTTALTAVREAAEADGVRVVGGALAGKAAQELADGSGIEARTLASWERSWEAGFDRLGKGDVFVVDEAGMVGAAQMGRILSRIEEAGAKVVLTGDERQLQPIEAGAAFRTLRNRAEDRGDFAELSQVRRQTDEWQRQASQLFGQGEAGKALDVYNRAGEVRFENSVEQTRDAIVGNYFAKLDEARERSPDGVRGTDHIVTAYRNVDVDQLNAAIRAGRVERGELGQDATFRTDRGERTFAEGDKVLLTRNDRTLGLANGDRAEVVAADTDRLDIRLKDGREVSLKADSYDGVQPGYAVTTHKSQGMTVDRVHVMAGDGMHSSLAYVAMTRQREGATLYAAREHFRNYDALRGAIGNQRESSAVGDYLPRTNAVDAVRERIEQTDASRGSAQGNGAEHGAAVQDVAGIRSAMREAWKSASDRLADDGANTPRDHEAQAIPAEGRGHVARRTGQQVQEQASAPGEGNAPKARERVADRGAVPEARSSSERREPQAETTRARDTGGTGQQRAPAREEQPVHDARHDVRSGGANRPEHGQEAALGPDAGRTRDAGREVREPASEAKPSRLARLRAFVRGGSRNAAEKVRSPEPKARDGIAPAPSRKHGTPPAEQSRHSEAPSVTDRKVSRAGAENQPGRAPASDAARNDRAGERTATPAHTATPNRGHNQGVQGRETRTEQQQSATAQREQGRSEAGAGREGLKERLQAHAAGRTPNLAADGERRERLRQKLTDHAAGKVSGKAAGQGAGRGKAKGSDGAKDRGRDRGRSQGQENGR